MANVKGVGSRSKEADKTGWHVYWYRGSLTRVEAPARRKLQRYTRIVKKNGLVPEILRAQEHAEQAGERAPVPDKLGQPSVFSHVVYIIKENRTYDQVFGDLPQGNGDPSLCIYPRRTTPNHHALAESFVLLDNWYCNGVNSADGHSWATEGNVTDHLERSFGGFTRSYTFGDDPLTYSSSGFIWDNVLERGLSFRNFGEMNYTDPIPPETSFSAIYSDFTRGANRIKYTHKIGIERLARYSSPDAPGWNMAIPDVVRADVFLRELADAERSGAWPNFTILYLPQDHTSGTKPGMPTPEAHIADNDLALGRVVEGLSKSRFWKETCIFVVEDDPQDGFDHVDGHRSVCLVISPYTKRGKVISDFYNQTSVIHTMERILGLPPMNQTDSMAPLMTACFVDTPDCSPYEALPNNVPLDQLNPDVTALDGEARRWAVASLEQDFEQVDAGDEDTLNRVLWHAAKGKEAPYPTAFAGAHGKGLAALGLTLSDDDEISDD